MRIDEHYVRIRLGRKRRLNFCRELLKIDWIEFESTSPNLFGIEQHHALFWEQPRREAEDVAMMKLDMTNRYYWAL
ncbi:hypothetical protein FRC03_001457 [Tulasnella sp. 419]|nr:hypothetical protein FRC03_001457 [Tulasnella sp. 419]